MGKNSPIGSFVETLEKPSTGVGREVKRNVSELNNEFWSQLLGVKVAGEKSVTTTPETAKPNAKAGVIYEAAMLPKSSEKKPAATPNKDRLVAKPEKRAAAIEYYDYHKEIINAEKKASHTELREMNSRIEQIQTELKKLVATSRELQMEFGGFTVQQTTKEPGKYYINFFEWLLIVIKTAQEKVENSRAWLNTVKGKGRKGDTPDYWQMYKKHGTSFGLSSERSTATQTG